MYYSSLHVRHKKLCYFSHISHSHILYLFAVMLLGTMKKQTIFHLSFQKMGVFYGDCSSLKARDHVAVRVDLKRTLIMTCNLHAHITQWRESPILGISSSKFVVHKCTSKSQGQPLPLYNTKTMLTSCSGREVIEMCLKRKKKETRAHLINCSVSQNGPKHYHFGK